MTPEQLAALEAALAPLPKHVNFVTGELPKLLGCKAGAKQLPGIYIRFEDTPEARRVCSIFAKATMAQSLAMPPVERSGPPSPKEIEDARTPNGGWTRAKLAEWGVPWPPPQGWREKLEREWAETSSGTTGEAA